MLASNLIEMTPNLKQVMFTLNGGTFSWKSSKQDMFVNSNIVSEYIVASDGSCGSSLEKKNYFKN